MAGYVNTVRAIVCSELSAREASSFCDFWNLTSCDFIPFIIFFHMCLLRINWPKTCLNMNHFDAVDSSECHSEEVISFFWCSVYVQWTTKDKIIDWKAQVKDQPLTHPANALSILLAENQKGTNAVPRCSIQNQKGAPALSLFTDVLLRTTRALLP